MHRAADRTESQHASDSVYTIRTWWKIKTGDRRTQYDEGGENCATMPLTNGGPFEPEELGLDLADDRVRRVL